MRVMFWQRRSSVMARKVHSGTRSVAPVLFGIFVMCFLEWFLYQMGSGKFLRQLGNILEIK